MATSRASASGSSAVRRLAKQAAVLGRRSRDARDQRLVNLRGRPVLALGPPAQEGVERGPVGCRGGAPAGDEVRRKRARFAAVRSAGRPSRPAGAQSRGRAPVRALRRAPRHRRLHEGLDDLGGRGTSSPCTARRPRRGRSPGSSTSTRSSSSCCARRLRPGAPAVLPILSRPSAGRAARAGRASVR